MSKVPDLVNKCLRTGMNAIALTDHGNMYGIKELLDYCKGLKEPFKPIVGCEVYCARRGRHSMEAGHKEDRSGWHLILLAKNMTGYHNLCKIVSAGFMEDAYFYTPRIDKELLEQYHEGIIASSACLGGELSQKVMAAQRLNPSAPDYTEVEEAIEWFKSLFGEDYYVEIQRHQTDKPGGDQEVYQRQMEVNPVLIDLAHKHGVKVIATNDAHFVEEEHGEAHDRLICISTGQYLDDEKRMHYTKQEWLKTPEEMAAIFADIPEVLSNTQEIVDKVEVYDIDHDPIMPLFPIPESFGTKEQTRQKYTKEQLYTEFTTDDMGLNPLPEEEGQKKIKKLGGYDRLYRIKFEAEYLEQLTMEGAWRRYPELRELTESEQNVEGLRKALHDTANLTDRQKQILDRIRFELHVMKTMGFPGYFLIVMDFIRGAREELGVSVGPGRGSAAGSVVAYCLHITDLDPLTYDLLFERFLNPDRISLPDIDTDFDDAGRGKVLDWISQKYGRTHVAHIITYGTMATKSALADVGRVQRVPLARVNEIKKLVPDEFPEKFKDKDGKLPKINLRNCYKYVDELKDMLQCGEPEVRQMLTYAEQLEDTIRQVGIHACGVIIGADDLTNFAPLASVLDKDSNQRVLVTEYDGHVVESVGLIKMDFLGLKTLTIIKECLELIRRSKGEEVDIDHIPLNDELTYKLFQEGKTIAVFQFESPGMQKYLRELKPTVITDLIAMNALYRPGPIQYIPNFIKRKHGEEPIVYDLPEMEEFLKDTYGVTVYQEQVMLLSRKLAGFTRGESDALRKAMGKKKIAIVEQMEKKFLEGGKALGHDEAILKKIYNDWRSFASYAFNKSHAACYAWVAYQTGYLKAHYPAEFMAANLTTEMADIKTVTKYMDECKALGIDVLSPDVNESALHFTVNKQGQIRFGLGGIKGIGEAAVESIIHEREEHGAYKSIYDFVERIDLRACNKKAIESLAMSGALDCFADSGFYREQLMGVNDRGELGSDILVRYGQLYQADRTTAQNTLFGDMFSDMGGAAIAQPPLPAAERMSTIERLNHEKELIGIFLSAHPLDEYEFEIRNLGNTNAAELNWFRSHEKEEETKDGRRRRHIRIRDWQGVTMNAEEDPETSETPETSQTFQTSQTSETASSADEAQRLHDWVERHHGPIHLGGIVTRADELISRAGKPYGRYAIEDYTGSYEFVLFDEAYRVCAPLLKPNLYVYLTGVLQQAGSGQKWFHEAKIDDADWEVRITGVQMLSEVQDKQVEALNISIPIAQLSSELTTSLSEHMKAARGPVRLTIDIYDPSRQNAIHMLSRGVAIHVDAPLYGWLKSRKNEGQLDFQVNVQ